MLLACERDYSVTSIPSLPPSSLAVRVLVTLQVTIAVLGGGLGTRVATLDIAKRNVLVSAHIHLSLVPDSRVWE